MSSCTMSCHADYLRRFVDTEKWRKDIDLDTLAANWEYPEKRELAQYYKQFYHKTDKVRDLPLCFCKPYRD